MVFNLSVQELEMSNQARLSITDIFPVEMLHCIVEGLDDFRDICSLSETNTVFHNIVKTDIIARKAYRKAFMICENQNSSPASRSHISRSIAHLLDDGGESKQLRRVKQGFMPCYACFTIKRKEMFPERLRDSCFGIEKCCSNYRACIACILHGCGLTLLAQLCMRSSEVPRAWDTTSFVQQFPVVLTRNSGYSQPGDSWMISSNVAPSLPPPPLAIGFRLDSCQNCGEPTFSRDMPSDVQQSLQFCNSCYNDRSDSIHQPVFGQGLGLAAQVPITASTLQLQ